MPLFRPALTTLAGAVLATTFSALPLTPAEASMISNPTCASSTTAWKASSNAKMSRGKISGEGVCVVTSRVKKRDWVYATGNRSTSTVPVAGSTVHTAAKIKGVKGRAMKLRLQEISSSGAVLRTFESSLKSTTGYQWMGAELKTTRAGSRVQVRVGGSVSAKKAIKFSNLSVTATKPPASGSTTTPTPTPTPTPKPTPTPTTPANVPCSERDYSKPGQGTLSFSDEFNGTGVDTSKWRVRDGESLSFDKARIQARNVSVRDGRLEIKGKRENAAGRQWTTGYLDTIGKHAQKYGRWEMRAKIPTDSTRTKGVWPAFWLRSSSPGEIDIMESYGSPSNYDQYNPSKRYEWTIWKYSTVPSGQTNERVMGHHQPATAPGQGYHTYAVDWSPECFRFSFDGVTTGVVPMDAKPWLKTQFKDPFHIRLNMQVGSSYWGFPNDAETKPEFSYLIDHVRVYAPKD